MVVTVRKKEFNIELVSNYVHKLYSELTEASFELSETSNELQEVGIKHIQDIKGVKDKDEIKRMNEEFNSIVVQENKRIKDLTKEIISKRWLIIKELIEVNGYEYDAEWWDRRTSVDDLNNFMLECMGNDKKDSKAYGKKK